MFKRRKWDDARDLDWYSPAEKYNRIFQWSNKSGSQTQGIVKNGDRQNPEGARGNINHYFGHKNLPLCTQLFVQCGKALACFQNRKLDNFLSFYKIWEHKSGRNFDRDSLYVKYRFYRKMNFHSYTHFKKYIKGTSQILIKIWEKYVHILF